MDEPEETDRKPPRRPSVYCGDCHGTGTRVEPHLYVKGDQATSMFSPSRCRTCRGQGVMAS